MDRIQSLEVGKEILPTVTGGDERRRRYSTTNYMAKDVDMQRVLDWGPKPQPTSADKNDNAIFPSSNTTSKERAVSLAWK